MAEHSTTPDRTETGRDEAGRTETRPGGNPASGAAREPGSLDALRRSPAGHLAEQMREAGTDGERGVRLAELPFRPQIGVRSWPGTPSCDAVEAALGLPMPTRCGESTGDAAGLHSLWLSPDEFLVVDASRRQVPGEARRAEEALEGLPGQVIDLSGNRTILELSGPRARAVLEKGCHVDLHPREFPVGAVASTALGPVQVILHRSGPSTFRVYPRASFAEYTVHWLIDGMREFASPPID